MPAAAGGKASSVEGGGQRGLQRPACLGRAGRAGTSTRSSRPPGAAPDPPRDAGSRHRVRYGYWRTRGRDAGATAAGCRRAAGSGPVRRARCRTGGAPAGTGQARPPRAAAPCHRPRPTRAAGSGVPVRPRRSPRPATGPPGGPAGRRHRRDPGRLPRRSVRPPSACSRRHGRPAGAARSFPARWPAPSSSRSPRAASAAAPEHPACPRSAAGTGRPAGWPACARRGHVPGPRPAPARAESRQAAGRWRRQRGHCPRPG